LTFNFLFLAATSNNEHIKDQAIIIGLAGMFILTTAVLTILILISWRKINVLKKQVID